MAKISEVIENKIPDFIGLAKGLFASDYDDFIASYDRLYKKSIRINTSKIDADFVLHSDLDVDLVDGLEDVFFVNDESISKHPYHSMGLFYFQELSASKPVSFLEFDEDARVLDLCAAPGGKTLQLALKLSSSGELYSNDISVSRQRATVKNIEKYGISNAVVLAENPEKLSAVFREYFEVILVDAPCSGEGMFAKDSSVLKSWSIDKTIEYAAIQEKLLDYASTMLSSGGRIMYSTCTFNSSENEAVISRFLEKHHDFKAVKISGTGLESGLGDFSEEVLACSNRVLPHKSNALGHYFILLEHKGEKEERLPLINDVEPPDYFRDFCSEIGYECKRGYYIEISSKLYYTAHQFKDMTGVRVLRTGLLLGEMKKGKFIPSQAFAMTLSSENLNHVIHYTSSDDEVYKYLRGETLNVKLDKGYYLVFVDNYPCGFVLSDGKKLKNKFKRDWIQS